MVIGNGILAKEFDAYTNDENILIFASGVSNSNETSSESFEREKSLLIRTMREQNDKQLIYFSTCSVYDTYFENNAYTQHKLNMEKIILSYSKKYIIFRLPQVLGLNNKYQLMGFLYGKIKAGEKFNLFDIERNIIDIEDVKSIVDYILVHELFKNKIVNIANPENIKVLELVKLLEGILKVQSKYDITHKEGSFNINIDDLTYIIDELGLFKGNYIKERILKYYE